MRISFKEPCYIKLHETVKAYLRDLPFSWAAVSGFFWKEKRGQIRDGDSLCSLLWADVGPRNIYRPQMVLKEFKQSPLGPGELREAGMGWQIDGQTNGRLRTASVRLAHATGRKLTRAHTHTHTRPESWLMCLGNNHNFQRNSPSHLISSD